MPPKDPAKADIENRFKFHPATEVTGPQHDAVRADFLRLALKLHKALPDGRQKSLALTALEEGMHWANAAIACGQPAASPAADATPAPSGPTSTDVDGRRARRSAAQAAPVKSTRRVTRRRSG